jgi:hypothetical protein
MSELPPIQRQVVVSGTCAAATPVYVRLAQEDDQSVVRELLEVRVQPWHVALEGGAHPGRA